MATIDTFTGFELGTLSDPAIIATSGTISVSTSVKHSGSYALRSNPTGTASGWARVGRSTNVFTVHRFYFYASAIPSTDTVFAVAGNSGVGPTSGNLIQFVLKTTGVVDIIHSSGPASISTSSPVISAGTWYRFDLQCLGTGSNRIKVQLDGVEFAASTGTTGDDYVFYLGKTSTNNESVDYYYDDYACSNTDADYPLGAAKSIARQGKSGAVTYDAWTKSSGSTAYNLWSETPFNATNACNSGSTTSSVVQTMLSDAFSSGTDAIGASDTINAVRVCVVAKTSATSNGGATGSIRRRVGGSDTDSALTLTTSDAFYQSAIFTDTRANLDAMEVGFVKPVSAAARTQTVEDVWTLVDYKPANTITADASITEATDSSTSAAANAIAAALSKTESADSISSTAALATVAAVSVTESADTIASTATLAIAANASITESADTIVSDVAGQISSASGWDALWSGVGILSNDIAASASITEAADSVSSAAALAIAAASSVTESSDSVSATATVATAASASITESADSISALAANAIAASASVTEAADSVSAAATLAIAATASVSESNDSISATASLGIAASVAKTEADDSVASASTLAIAAAVSVTESSDSAASTAAVSLTATLALTEDDDSLSAAAIQNGANSGEGWDSLWSGLRVFATLDKTASASITEDADSVSATATNKITSFADLVEVGDIVVSAGALRIAGALTVTEDGDTLQALASVSVTQTDSGAFFLAF